MSVRHITLIGMSNIGKSATSIRIQSELGYERVDCDPMVNEKILLAVAKTESNLKLDSIEACATWMGQPGSDNPEYEQRSALFVQCEREVMQEVGQKLSGPNDAPLVRQDIRFKLPKTDRTRAIVLPDYAVEELRLWKAIQARELLSRGVTPTEDIFVCGRYWDGGPIKPGSLTGQFRRMVRTIPNIPVVRLHDLRHSHATQLLAEGIHPKIAQERLGHSSITVTLDLYSHAAPTMQYEAAIKLDLAFKAVLLKQEGSICTGAQTLH